MSIDQQWEESEKTKEELLYDILHPTCNICEQNQSVGVASSPLGAFSNAYCSTCLEKGAEPLWLWHSTFWACGGPEYIDESYREWACSVYDNEYIYWDRIVELYDPAAYDIDVTFGVD